MQITDAQVHIWGPDTPRYPWPADGNPPHKPEPFTGDDLVREMDEAGVDRALVVPPTFAGGHNRFSLDAAHRYPDRIAVMGVLNLQAPDAPERLATWKQQPGMVGIRVNFRKRVPRELLEQGRLDWFLAGAQEHGIPISFLARHVDLHLIRAAATRYPQLKLSLDHLGLTEGKGTGAEAFADFDEVLKLGPLPNVTVKVSALPAYAADPYPYPQLHPFVRQVYDAFGPRRMMWGTDLTRLPCTYRQAVTMFTEEIPWLTADDKEWIMGRSLCEWVGW
ncbi:amidohydrolase family protein [Dactylosporangium sp. AC04546]|uniref:amidohydrolase family protein n=1 Tax=Dactylosporangium sp. AC04546 TaxID=2862460 RepID=UPI001EDE0CC1|nr:amidohydrolase family protein [Dactylosporangium sp. AC04546]WVK79514.1 amidohydrolase family protein [Dactylosporangium sp. AC04546]